VLLQVHVAVERVHVAVVAVAFEVDDGHRQQRMEEEQWQYERGREQCCTNEREHCEGQGCLIDRKSVHEP